jgi:hypothetical protein
LLAKENQRKVVSHQRWWLKLIAVGQIAGETEVPTQYVPQGCWWEFLAGGGLEEQSSVEFTVGYWAFTRLRIRGLDEMVFIDPS